MASRRILFDDEEEDEEYNPNADTATATTAGAGATETTEEKKDNLEEEEEYVPNNEETKNEEKIAVIDETKEEAVAEKKDELVEEKLDDEEEYSPNYSKFDAGKKEEVDKVEAEIDSTAKAQTAGGSTGAPKATVMANAAPTDAELKLKEEAEMAKTKLIKEIQDLKLGEEAVVGDLENEKEDPRVQKFSVINPVKISGHVKYTVNGVDDEGDFTEVRRFREFHALGQVLRTRWPGCYVPSIPEKKMLQKNNEQFTEERRSLLERFMKEIAKYDYIVFSKEFKVFARGKGEIDKVLFSLPKQTPMQVLEKYRLNFKIDEEQDQTAVNKYKENIMIFQQFLKKAIGIMEMQKKQLKNMSSVRDKQDAAQSEFMYELMKYEDIGIAYYSDQDYKRRILTHPDSEDLKEKVDKSSKKWRNPYREAYLWLKGEFLDVSGMYDGLQGREGVMKAQLNTEQKKRDDQKELDKLTLGKTTMKSLFKSKSQKESNILSLQAAIEIADQEIIDFRKLINFLTIYHGQIAIPKFKAAKAKMYLKSLNNFCVKEISNAHLAATLYNSLLEIEKKE